jgi:hypothetical protein
VLTPPVPMPGAPGPAASFPIRSRPTTTEGTPAKAPDHTESVRTMTKLHHLPFERIRRRLAGSVLDSPVLAALEGSAIHRTGPIRATADRPHQHWREVADTDGTAHLEARWHSQDD